MENKFKNGSFWKTHVFQNKSFEKKIQIIFYRFFWLFSIQQKKKFENPFSGFHVMSF